MMQKLNQDLSYVPAPPGPPAATPRSPRGKERYQTGEPNEEHQLLPRSLFPVDSTAVAEGDMSSAASRTREFRQIRKCKSATFTVDGYSYTIVANPSSSSFTEDDTGNSASKNGDIPRQDYKIYKRAEGKRKLKRQDSKELDEESLSSLDLSKMDELPAISSAEAVAEAMLRLRSLVLRLEREEISTTDLKSNLQYAAGVLENLKDDQNRTPSHKANQPCQPKKTSPAYVYRFNYQGEEDDLSEVATEDVPEQVRHWLTSTFSRQSTRSRLGDEKPKFRSIVQALRTGLFIDRMFRRTSGLLATTFPAKVMEIFKNLDEWSFDIFTLNEASDGHALKCTAYELFTRYDLIAKFKIPVQNLNCFLEAMENGYSKHGNPYHNLLHAADVTQTLHHMLVKMGLMHWLTDIEIIAALLAAIIHDFEHTGTTNAFHVNTGSDMALLYNDRAVLENHHISSSFRLMKEDDKNFLVNVNRDDYTELRNLVIDMVLATDMSYHFQQLKQVKTMIGMADSSALDKPKAMALALHCADISHPAKDWALHHKWTTLLMHEFFRQGDREKELGVAFSPLCDRKTTMVAESQIGFIDFIVEPSLIVCCDMIDKVLQELPPSAPDESSLRTKRNSIPLARPTSTPRTSSVPGYQVRSRTISVTGEGGLEGQPNRPPSSPGRISLSRRSSIPIKAVRSWAEPLMFNKNRWKEYAATEVKGHSRLSSMSEEHTSDMSINDVFPNDDDRDTNITNSPTASPSKDSCDASSPRHNSGQRSIEGQRSADDGSHQSRASSAGVTDTNNSASRGRSSKGIPRRVPSNEGVRRLRQGDSSPSKQPTA
ncbi:dual specificity calcium/calmodulin-dependent 3',5'-cyclic nucleotide phosphodiesterase 1A-like isoform X2 [Asterias amurensis]|uniref:dual specificity calcium/calmodulin-dependent 3',5'-cyclic nucleotide phosphodiesterase 1A-like isoform X2 n=1 Tax=Asterias amurensis TaxID=7602 RepID=UPI003AB18B7B